MAPLTKSLAAMAVFAPAVALQLRDDEECGCLNWKDAYGPDFGAVCGDTGLEFHEILEMNKSETKELRRIAHGLLGGTWCDRVFKRLDGNFCVNADYRSHDMESAEWYHHQWCYVSTNCWSANSYGTEGATVRHKLCDSKDDLLVEKSPEELALLAASQGLDLWKFAHFAYNMYVHASVKQVEDSFLGGGPNPLDMGLQLVVASNKPWLIEGDFNNPPALVIYGNKLYKLKSPERDLDEGISTAPVGAAQMNSVGDQLVCVHGC